MTLAGKWDPEYDDWGEALETPPMARRRAWRLGKALDRAVDDLKQARDLEVETRQHHESALRRAQLSKAAEAPRPVRGGATVAERQAWVEEQCAESELAADLAKVRREAAKDQVAKLEAQTMLAQSLLKSIDAQYVREHTHRGG